MQILDYSQLSEIILMNRVRDETERSYLIFRLIYYKHKKGLRARDKQDNFIYVLTPETNNHPRYLKECLRNSSFALFW